MGAAKTNPVVAVLICVYKNDRLDLFQRAVDSIAGQTYPQQCIHIYLGVDGSVAADISDYIEHNRIRFYKIIRNPRNYGLAKTLNILIENLEDEEFIFRMDSDDISVPLRFATQIRYLKTHPEVEILGTGLIEVSPEGIEIARRRYPVGKSEVLRYICKASPVAHPTICFRKSFFGKGLRYPENTGYNEDIALWFLALMDNVTISNISEPLYMLTVSQNFYNRRSLGKAVSEFVVYIKGIWSLYGPTWRYVYPLFRFAFRLTPTGIIRAIYNGSMRGKILNTAGPIR